MVIPRPVPFQDALGSSKVLRLIAAAALAGGTLLGAGSAYSAKQSYTFAGLEWGSSPKVVIAKLKSKGFKGFKTANGRRLEFAMRDAHGVFVRRNRGKRVIARGKWSGARVTVEMIFGKNNKLQRVILSTANWNGTSKGAKKLTGLANALVNELEEKFGPTAKKSQPFGFVDTATWAVAEDNSRMQLYVRGTNGFMFYPRDKTGLRVHFSNPRFGGPADPAPGFATVGSRRSTPIRRQPANKTNRWDGTSDR